MPPAQLSIDRLLDLIKQDIDLRSKLNTQSWQSLDALHQSYRMGAIEKKDFVNRQARRHGLS